MRDNFEIPNAEDNIRGYKGEKAYRLLEDDGVVATESPVLGGDILIGKLVLQDLWKNIESLNQLDLYRRDTSIGVRPSETGVVDTVVNDSIK